MKWVWERRRTLIFWAAVLYLLGLAVALTIGMIADVVDPPKPVNAP